jgi:hypothetical protein
MQRDKPVCPTILANTPYLKIRLRGATTGITDKQDIMKLVVFLLLQEFN